MVQQKNKDKIFAPRSKQWQPIKAKADSKACCSLRSIYTGAIFDNNLRKRAEKMGCSRKKSVARGKNGLLAEKIGCTRKKMFLLSEKNGCFRKKAVALGKKRLRAKKSCLRALGYIFGRIFFKLIWSPWRLTSDAAVGDEKQLVLGGRVARLHVVHLRVHAHLLAAVERLKGAKI
jgi:hypothetical protein